MGLEVLHLDRFYWRAGWVETPKGEWARKVEGLVARESWVMDGNYSGTLGRRLEACDTVVFVDLPRAVCAIYATDDRWTDDVHWRGGALRLVDLVDYCHYMTPMTMLPPVRSYSIRNIITLALQTFQKLDGALETIFNSGSTCKEIGF